MIKVGIVGATGYTGGELVRILLSHPKVNLKMVTSKSYVGKSLSSIYPSLIGATDLACCDLDMEKLARECDVVFIALPHGHAKTISGELLNQGKKVIDLGADFRLKDISVYQQWYEDEPAESYSHKQAVYGMPELHRKEIQTASLIANPGCRLLSN